MTRTKLLILISFLFVTHLAFGQNQKAEDMIREGVALHDKGEYQKAIETYQKVLEMAPNSSVANYEISYSYLAAKDYKNAEKFSKKVIDLNNGNVLGAYITYGNALDLQGKTKKAMKVYESAAKDFHHYLVYYNYAICCFNAGETDKAYDLAIKAITDYPSHASSHLILSKIMERKGSRIKAMLPLYFFLLLEPNSGRSAVEYQTLRNYIDHGVTREGEKNINVVVPEDEDPDFGAAEMMVSLSKASNSLEENKGKTDLELFAENNDNIFKVMGELKKDHTGFWWDFYVSFFYRMANENLTKPFSYYISESDGDEAAKWLNDHPEEFDRFKIWMNIPNN
ncbi:tetratricopeptide repeat protein [Prolixibacter bellariivorans]|nr:tetratricopeptide repeat protein [Prolixibacter bellariivorans]